MSVAPTVLWTSDEVAAATGGRLVGAEFRAFGVAFDSREVAPGDLFLALGGAAKVDYAADALASGAVGAVALQASDRGPTVVVDDAMASLDRLARAARERSSARRAAVTGSVGKTGVTQAVLAGLRAAGRAHGPVRSFNNHVGVPLTLARMPRATARAVFELGMNHAGEIETLVDLVRPHVAAVTAVGPVHVENFADGELGVARAKAEILGGLAPGGTAVLNADDRWFALLSDAAHARGARVLSFGTAGRDARLLAIESRGGELRIHAEIFGRRVDYDVGQGGAHWGPNSLCVALVLHALDVELASALATLRDLQALPGRGAERRLALEAGAAMLIDESYNANPLSMAAAVAALGGRPGRRIAVLTDMLELGSQAERRHVELASAIDAADVALVFAAGPLMRMCYDALPHARRGGWAADATALAPMVVEAIRPGDVVMVKGSNGSHAGVVTRALERAGGIG